MGSSLAQSKEQWGAKFEEMSQHFEAYRAEMKAKTGAKIIIHEGIPN